MTAVLGGRDGWNSDYFAVCLDTPRLCGSRLRFVREPSTETRPQSGVVKIVSIWGVSLYPLCAAPALALLSSVKKYRHGKPYREHYMSHDGASAVRRHRSDTGIFPALPTHMLPSHGYSIIPSSVRFSWITARNLSAVVAIGVDRGGDGRDNGARWLLLVAAQQISRGGQRSLSSRMLGG
jgi:hypothetical protein